MESFSPINSMMRAAALAQMIRRSAMEEEAANRAMVREQREQQLQDIDTRMKFNTMGRPVRGGMVEEILAPPAVEGITPEVAAGAAMPVGRKVDPSRHVKYRTAAGETLEAELYTPEEQIRRRFSAEAAEEEYKQRMRVNADVAKIAALRDIGESPGAIADRNRAAAEATRLTAVKERKALQEDQQAFSASEKKKDRLAANARESAREAGRNSRDASKKAAKDAEESEAHKQRMFDRYKADHDKADTEEQARHAEAVELGKKLTLISEQLKAAEESEDTVQIRRLNADRIAAESRIKRVRQEAEQFNRKKKEALRRANSVYGETGAPPSEEANKANDPLGIL